MAQFHANKIRPSRIAYRIGIDIALVEALVAGEEEVERFPQLVAYYRKQRYHQRLWDAKYKKGIVQYELQTRIESEFRQETDL